MSENSGNPHEKTEPTELIKPAFAKLILVLSYVLFVARVSELERQTKRTLNPDPVMIVDCFFSVPELVEHFSVISSKKTIN